MCGIAGFYSTNADFSEQNLKEMTDTIAHRGPDAAGYFYKNTIGLGHRRLSVLDLSESANQPMTSDCGRYTIIYNGEIYNYKEIRAKIIPEQKLKTTTDTEVILYAFIKNGIEVVHEFNGMFAIAIWDNLENTLYAFRDRMGIKPFYYYWDSKNFVFASEIKSLLKLPLINNNKQLNNTAIANYLYLGYIPEPDSIFKSIKKMPSGSYAILKNNKLEIKKYWELKNKLKKDLITDEAEAKAELKKLLISSVNYRLISDVPFGTFLSGGTDSSVVTAIAQSVSNKPINTFSIAFDDQKHNEAPFAKKVANFLGTQHHELKATEKEAQALFPKIFEAYDEPMADSSALPTMLVSKLARQNVTMALSGDGGDELFMGYGMYNWAQRLNNSFAKNLKLPLRLIANALPHKHHKVKNLTNYSSTKHLKSHIFSQEQMLFAEEELYTYLQKNHLTTVEVNENYFDLPRKLTAKEEQSFFDLNYYLKDDLMVKVDRASMQFALEVRVPLLDYRIVEFSLNLSEKLKVKNKVQKYLLKEVLYDYIPKEYFERPKWGFSVPLVRWLKNDLSYLIDEYLSEENIKKTGVLKHEMVARLIQNFRAGNDYNYNKIWQLIILQRFLLSHY
jgi:asparagine synthase (glutamine-hydrolysing)